MPIDTQSAFGTKLQLGNGATPEVFTDVARIRAISGPDFALDTEDITTHDSTSAWEEIAPTILRSGELSLDLLFVPTEVTHNASAGLLQRLRTRTKTNFKLIFPDAGLTTWSFAGYVTGFELGAPVDEQLQADVTIKLTGAPTLA